MAPGTEKAQRSCLKEARPKLPTSEETDMFQRKYIGTHRAAVTTQQEDISNRAPVGKWSRRVLVPLSVFVAVIFGVGSVASAAPVQVKRGDTFSALVRTHCGTNNWEAVAFPGRDKNKIYAGETIDITCPGQAPAGPAPAPQQQPQAPAAQSQVWFHPVPGRCPSMNTGWEGGAWGAGRSYGHHQGQDFGAATGTPIHAIGGGTIVYAGNSGNAGNQIQMQIGDLRIKYNHLSSFRRTGGWVAPNEVIGYVGATGRAFGSHLHIEIWRNGTDLDPKVFLRSVGVNVYC